jgi:hypothetical protein
MTILEYLSGVQRRSVLAILGAWCAGVVAMLLLRPSIALPVLYSSLLAMLATFVYFYRAAHCPRCGAKLWLRMSRIVPIGPFKAKLAQCPSCRVSVHLPAEA